MHWHHRNTLLALPAGVANDFNVEASTTVRPNTWKTLQFAAHVRADQPLADKHCFGNRVCKPYQHGLNISTGRALYINVAKLREWLHS